MRVYVNTYMCACVHVCVLGLWKLFTNKILNNKSHKCLPGCVCLINFVRL